MHVEIVLVRHGESEGNRDRLFTGHGPSRLTALGRAQAEATAHALAAAPVHHIYSSDLVRCVETAAPLVLATGLRPVESSLLRERDVGEFTGLSFEQVQARWPEGWKALASRDAEFRPPGGESHTDCRRRVGGWLDGLLDRHPEGRVVVFSHGVAINHMLRHLLGLDHDGSVRATFTVDNCSIQRFQQSSAHRGVRVLALNDTAHLSSLDRDSTRS